jgi:periplasmic protein CpxP/Spy
MNKTFQKTLIATALVCVGALAQAQSPRGQQDAMGMGMPGPHFGPMHRPDPAKMQAMFDKHMARLKTVLQLAPNQESDWAAFNSAMTPPASRPARPSREELEKLTTPDRIDRLNALRAQHASLLDKRGDAAKKFYATLTPSQRKVFDLETLKYLQPKQRMQWLHQLMQHEHPPK